MAMFYNQATLSYNDTVSNSNIVSGELVEVLSMTKTALNTVYNAGDTITYVLSIVNSGSTEFTGATVLDNLGSYVYGTTTTLTPLTYVSGSARYYVNGIQQSVASATVTDQSVEFTGLTIPANGIVMIIYEATANSYAPLGTGSDITNTATLNATGLSTAVTADLTLAANTEPNLSILKAVSPVPVAENGQLTYTFTIQNSGPVATILTDSLVISDTFNPILTGITVTLNGTALTTAQYSYDQTTGVFSTADNIISVPAATYEQDAVTGEYVTTPGSVTLVVTGTV